MVEDTDEAKHRLSTLMSDLKIWMARRKLKLNDGKTEIIAIRGNLRNVSIANFGEVSFGDTGAEAPRENLNTSDFDKFKTYVLATK